MKVIDRVRQMIEDYLSWGSDPNAGTEQLIALFTKHLNEHTEDCAKQADEAAQEQEDMAQWPDAARYVASRAEIAQGVGEAIRALAESTEERKKGEIERWTQEKEPNI